MVRGSAASVSAVATVVLAMTLAVGLLVPVGGAAFAAAAAGEPIRLGFINHLTGDAAVYGESMRKGTQLAVEETNASGGINGRPVEVVYVDDQLNAAQAVAGVRRLIERDRVPVIMGSGSSSITLAIGPVAREARVVLISSISTAPALKDLGPYFFAVMASDFGQGEEWANIARRRGIKEAAVAYINNDYGIGVKDVFTRRFTEDGGKILASVAFSVGATDLRTEILKLRQSRARTVFVVSHVREGALLIKQAAELGLRPQWIGDVALQTREVPELAGSAAEGMLALSAGVKGEAYERFARRFVERYGEEPTIWSDFAYDTTRLVVEAIRVNGYSAEGIRRWLDRVEGWPGASGRISFDENGIRSVDGAFQLYQVVNGRWVPVP